MTVVTVVIVTVVTVVIVTVLTVAVVTVVIVTYFSKKNLTPQQPMICYRGSFSRFSQCFVAVGAFLKEQNSTTHVGPALTIWKVYQLLVL